MPPCWKDFRDRIITEGGGPGFIVKNADALKLGRSKSLLAVGTAMGQRDSALVKMLMPDVKFFAGVDVEERFLKTSKENMDALGKGIKVETFHGTLPQYPGPSSTVDLIMMEHLAWYKLDKEQMARVYTWLNPGGWIIMAINNSIWNKKLVEALPEMLMNNGTRHGIAPKSIGLWLDELGYDYQAHDHPDYLLDISNPGDGCFLSVSMSKNPTPDQLKTAMQVLKECANPGTEKVPFGVRYFVVKKA